MSLLTEDNLSSLSDENVANNFFLFLIIGQPRAAAAAAIKVDGGGLASLAKMR